MQIKAIQNNIKPQLKNTFNTAIPSKSNKDEVSFSSRIPKCKPLSFLSRLFQQLKDMHDVAKMKKALKRHEFKKGDYYFSQVQKQNEESLKRVKDAIDKETRLDDLRHRKTINSILLKDFTIKGNISKKSFSELIHDTNKLYDFLACQKHSVAHYSMEEKLVDRLKDQIKKVKPKEFYLAKRILKLSPNYISTKPLAELQSALIEEIGKRGSEKQIEKLVVPILEVAHSEITPSPLLTAIRTISERNNPQYSDKLASKLNDMANTKINFNKYINIPIVNELITALEKSKQPKHIGLLEKVIITQENSGCSGILQSARSAIKELRKYQDQ